MDPVVPEWWEEYPRRGVDSEYPFYVHYKCKRPGAGVDVTHWYRRFDTEPHYNLILYAPHNDRVHGTYFAVEELTRAWRCQLAIYASDPLV